MEERDKGWGWEEGSVVVIVVVACLIINYIIIGFCFLFVHLFVVQLFFGFFLVVLFGCELDNRTVMQTAGLAGVNVSEAASV